MNTLRDLYDQHLVIAALIDTYIRKAPAFEGNCELAMELGHAMGQQLISLEYYRRQELDA